LIIGRTWLAEESLFEHVTNIVLSEERGEDLLKGELALFYIKKTAFINPLLILKVVTNEKKGGLGSWQ
jgi:hypothetical protein